VAGALHLTDGALMSPRRPALDDALHCDVVQARGLLPVVAPKDVAPDQWRTDPYVTAQLVRSPEAGGRRTGLEAVTEVRCATLHPVWEAELLLPVEEGAAAVRFAVHEADALHGSQALWFVDVPLPLRPPAVHGADGDTHTRRRRGSIPEAPPLHQGWFALQPVDEKRRAAARPLLAKLGRSETDHAPYGELHLCVSWGVGVSGAPLSHRPALRRRIGRLLLRIHCAEGLPHHGAGRHAVAARLEHQQAVTPACEHRGATPEWPAGESTFAFAWTEVTSDLVLTLVDLDHVRGARPMGEVILPLATLLSSRRMLMHHWAALLPGRRPGEPLLRPLPRPKHPLGRICFSLALEVESSAAFAYLGPDVPPRETAPGHVPQSDSFSATALHESVGRFLDAVLAPMVAPARTLLYLQAWQAPRLNCMLLIALTIATRPEVWPVTTMLTPLWLCLTPFLHGSVAARIRQGEKTPLSAEEAKDQSRRMHAESARGAAYRSMVSKARTEMLEHAARRDPSLAERELESLGPGGVAVAHLGHMLGDAAARTSESMDHLNVVKVIHAKLAMLHDKLLEAAAPAERAVAACEWHDAQLTRLLLCVVAFAGLAISAALAAGGWLVWLLGVTVRRIVFVAGLACFVPQAAPITRAAMETADECIAAALEGVATVTPMLHGPGLARAAPPPPKPILSAAVMRAQAEAEARREVDKQQEDRAAELAFRSTHRPARLALEDLTHGAWVMRLLARAPDAPRITHLGMVARALREPHHDHPDHADTAKDLHEHDELLRQLAAVSKAAHDG
jgi:hypothetical protein